MVLHSWQHYLKGVEGISSDDFAEYAKSQTKAVVEVLGVKSSVQVKHSAIS